MILATVQGGTGAGRRMHIRTGQRGTWLCGNGHRNHGWATVCLAFGCREKRP